MDISQRLHSFVFKFKSMKAISEMKPADIELLDNLAYEKYSSDPVTINKLYRRRGLKAVITKDGKDVIISQEDLFPHNYYPDKVPVKIEILKKMTGHEPGSMFTVVDRDTKPLAIIFHKWIYSSGSFLLWMDMMYENPEVFRPHYDI